MSKVFNTPFENSLRVLIVLGEKEMAQNLDMIAALDFVTVYGNSMGYTKNDLHGQNPFGFCEYTAKRELIAKALKELVMRGLVDIVKDGTGILYKLNKQGIGRTAILLYKNDYAEEYHNALKRIIFFTKDQNEQQIIARISERATRHLVGGFND